MIINEVYNWSKKAKQKLFLFKVDFDKAFDSINWSHLCLRWALVRTSFSGFEDVLGKAIRSHIFLFILAMEGIMVAMKSAVFGIGVSDGEVARYARILGCDAAYNRLCPNMSLKRNFQPIIDYVQGRLSTWKAKKLSFGGRITLIKSVL
uniref:Reverse transcriptase domain-containing protein n=1 Tax=Lactuca sativa TaxID=4236 RepID=A0A9R1VJH3_LACSA|nr:hypothetical protein LSAT_V11C500270210 [Lactuca sativa]